MPILHQRKNFDFGRQKSSRRIWSLCRNQVSCRTKPSVQLSNQTWNDLRQSFGTIPDEEIVCHQPIFHRRNLSTAPNFNQCRRKSRSHLPTPPPNFKIRGKKDELSLKIFQSLDSQFTNDQSFHTLSNLKCLHCQLLRNFNPASLVKVGQIWKC